MSVAAIEIQRNLIQINLDKKKTQLERNKLGQFSTSTELANEIIIEAKKLLDDRAKISFLDPAIGTGSFFNALLKNFPDNQIAKATGFEVDEHYGKPAKELWRFSKLEYNIEDFTSKDAPEKEENKYNLVICNPPYVRHHYLTGKKDILKEKAFIFSKMKLSGLSGLYGYFLGIAHNWMRNGAIAGWLIPSEFMDVNYGNAIKKYLLKEVTLIRIHRFNPNDLQFSDALVSSAVVLFKNIKPDSNYDIQFTFGGSLNTPEYVKEINSDILEKEAKWTRFPVFDERQKNKTFCLGDFFTIKRGIATGNNKFFILSEEEIINKDLPFSEFKPILPSPRDLETTNIKCDKNGYPILNKKLFVLDSSLTMDEMKVSYPSLFKYLKFGIENEVDNSYLCKSRKVWYKQEERNSAPFYCTYIGRINEVNEKPFRFIFNESKAIVTNSYLCLYPKSTIDELIDGDISKYKKIKEFLDSITIQEFIDEGRVYGGGMYKIEPKELAKVSINTLVSYLKDM